MTKKIIFFILLMFVCTTNYAQVLDGNFSIKKEIVGYSHGDFINTGKCIQYQSPQTIEIEQKQFPDEDKYISVRTSDYKISLSYHSKTVNVRKYKIYDGHYWYIVYDENFIYFRLIYLENVGYIANDYTTER